MQTRLSLLLIGLLGLLPYVSSIKLPPIPSFWAEWVAVVLALCWLASFRHGGAAPTAANAPSRWAIGSGAARPLRIPVAVLGFGVFGATLLLQLLLDRPLFKGAPVLVLLALVVAALVCIAAAEVRERGDAARLLDTWSLALVMALFLNLIVVLVERQGLHLYIYQWGWREPPNRAIGLLGQPNQLAAIAVLASVAAHYLWLRGRMPSFGHLLVSLTAGILIAGSASRAGVLLWLFGAVLAAIALRGEARRRQGWWLLLAGAALLALAQVGWKLTDSVPAGAVTALRGDTLGRVELFRDSWELIQRHPFEGVGYGNFMSARWNELTTSLLEPAAHHSHNLVTQIAVELGLVAAGGVLLPVGWALWCCLRVATRRGVAPEQFFAATVALLLAAYSMSEYPLWYTFFLIPFALMLGLVEQKDLRPKVTPAPRTLRWAGFTVALGLCGLFAFDYHRSEKIYSSLELQQRGDTGKLVHIPMQEAAKASMLSAFDVYANLMYSRALSPDGLLMGYKLGFSERAMLSMTNQETIGRQIALLIVANEPDAAQALLGRTHRNPDLERNTRDILRRLSHLHPALDAFVKALPPLPPRPQGQ